METQNIDIIDTNGYPHQLSIYLIQDSRMWLQRMKQIELQRMDYPNGNDEYIEVTDEIINAQNNLVNYIETKLKDFALMHKWSSDFRNKRLAEQKANALLTLLTSLRQCIEELYRKATLNYFESWNCSS